MRQRLQNERLKRGMTKQALADALGVSMQYVYLLETNRKDGTLKMWRKIQELFNISDGDLWLFMNENSSEKRQA